MTEVEYERAKAELASRYHQLLDPEAIRVIYAAEGHSAIALTAASGGR